MTELVQPALPTIDAAMIRAIVNGEHGDAFAVLGLQRNPNGEGLVIRALLPRAGSVDAVSEKGRKIASLERIHEAGLFEAVLPRRKNRFTYRFRIDGAYLLDDPYRYPSLVNADDIYLFNEGTHEQNYRWLGAHRRRVDGVDGVHFVVWAPAAKRVSVVGGFNDWDGRYHVMRRHPQAGLWEIFIPGIADWALYKFEILDARNRLLPLKADPFARSMQHPPETASHVVPESPYAWGDGDWMAARAERNSVAQAISIYEVHAGSWRRRSGEGNRYLSYVELADELIPYVVDMGFTHIQLMPLSEFPFDGSWGYQPIGLYAPTIRHGTPDELRQFVDRCHQAGLGVLLDWVPGHFPTDTHGIGRFDGTCLYEHADPRKGYHPDWNTLIYNYGRPEVQSYLLSNANYWLDEFHVDGLRVDAVASMLYLDYSRDEGQWIPNERGGRENLEAIKFLQTVNSSLYRNHPGIVMIAEESTAWPGVSEPVYNGGLGFGYKWNMGWMNDSLEYMQRDPIYRHHHADQMTFSIVYAWSEKYVLPLSHDEVVHGKRSLLNKMPGDAWRQFANLRAYLGYMWGHPGKKLLFMGGEFGQRREWNHDSGLDWPLLDDPRHAGVQRLVRDLNQLYRDLPALHARDASPDGFEWLQINRDNNSVFAWLRKGTGDDELAVIAVNLTPLTHHDYPLGVPLTGRYIERLNSDASDYGGSGQGNQGEVIATDSAADRRPASLRITLPPLAAVIFEFAGEI